MPFLIKEKNLARFWSRVNKTKSCWLWSGPKNELGYGITRWKIDGRYYNRAHRISLLLKQRKHLNKTKEVDHLCRNPSCVNPKHLQEVSHFTNMRRGKIATKKVCKNGHDFTKENTILRKDKRSRTCKECHSKSQRKFYLKSTPFIKNRKNFPRKRFDEEILNGK